ncbi:MAG: hypothetical protein H0V44_05025 [Planctomycetes bacterium]|nr:hypothetical protein [Planctomycetota bacterium]
MLQTAGFFAFIADNRTMGIHRSGLNGVASLIPRGSGNNLFVPSTVGLNYETLGLQGAPTFISPKGSPFEPRCEPMTIHHADERSVVLVQPETSHARVSARITFHVEEPHYLHQRIELTFHRRFVEPGRPSRFTSLFASYIHTPPDPHLYFKVDPGTSPLSDWIGITQERAGSPHLIKRLPSDRELDAAGHLAAMAGGAPLSGSDIAATGWPERAFPRFREGSCPFYYGICFDHMVLKMFRQPERVAIVYSPDGGGQEMVYTGGDGPDRMVRNPAWDFNLVLNDVEEGRTYAWDVCLALLPMSTRAQVVEEYRRYRARPEWSASA